MTLRADVLIIGSGIAALRAAVEVAGAGDVLILTKAEPTAGNTGYAQGGIAAAVAPDDSPALHAADTIAAGDGLCDERAVAALVEDGPQYVRELIEWGAQFDRAPGGQLALAIEGAHSARRVLHARDATGREIGRVLLQRVSGLPRITTHSHARVVRLLVDDGRCVGASFLDDDGSIADATASCVLLATGGAGHVYRETTNPSVATGDGVSMAYIAGARVADLEFVQFHPTALNVAGQPRFLLSEALRGEGARLLNAAGDRFMANYEPAGELAPRDRVARAIVRESQHTDGQVFLSMEHLDPTFVHERFPLISKACAEAGLDLARDRIPVGPAAHYVMGGVLTDLDGRTSLPGLYAAGEVACTGVHGANRLASNSLLEGLVFGARAGKAMRRRSEPQWPVTFSVQPAAQSPDPAVHAEPASASVVQDVMWRRVGLFRDGDGLGQALGVLESAWCAVETDVNENVLMTADAWRNVSVTAVARLIARAARRREESRGAHYRTDFPHRDDVHWPRRLSETRSRRERT